jgi:phage terminase large subunit-like protein
MPWQQHVADVVLELEADGSLVYNEWNLLVGRQEGKTELKFALAVSRLTAMVQTHGPQRVTYTMQNRKKARTRLERDYAPRLRAAAGFREIEAKSRQRPTRRTDWRLGMNSGVEAIQFGPDSWLQIDTPSRTADGHGDTLDQGLIDEAFAHEDDTVEAGMEPAMLTRRDAQLGVLSAAGDGRSKYLYRKLLRGRKLVEAGADAGVAYFEWSAPDDAEPGDPETWRACCPALGFTVAEAKIEALWRKALEGGAEAIDTFRRAYLCQWPEVPVLDDDVQHGVIPAAPWTAAADIGHRAAGRLRYALDVDVNAKGEEWCSIGCSDGVHLEDVTPLEVPGPDGRLRPTPPGIDWVVPAAVAKRDVIGELLLDPLGPAGKLVDPLEKAGITVRKVTPAEFVAASQQFLDEILAGRMRHIDQPRLNRAVAGAARRDVGDGAWKFSRKLSPVDISPLVAVLLARAAAATKSSGPLAMILGGS